MTVEQKPVEINSKIQKSKKAVKDMANSLTNPNWFKMCSNY